MYHAHVVAPHNCPRPCRRIASSHPPRRKGRRAVCIDTRNDLIQPRTTNNNRSRALCRSSTATESTATSTEALAVPAHSNGNSVSSEQQPPPLATLLRYAPVTPVVLGYAAFAGATTALVLAIPRLGQLTALVAAGDSQALLAFAWPTLALFVARAALTWASDAFLWHAAAAAAHRCRVDAFRWALHASESDLDALDKWDNGVDGGDSRVSDSNMSRMTTSEQQQLGGAAAVSARLGADGAARLGHGALSAEASLVSLLRALVPGVIQAAAVVVMMVRTSVPLSVFALVAVPAMAAAVAGAGAGVRYLAARAARDHVAVAARCAEVLASSELVKLYGAAAHETQVLGARSAQWLVSETRHRVASTAVPMAITFTYAASIVALLAGGCHLVGAGAITGAQFASFVAAAALLVEPVQAASDAYNSLQAQAYDVRRFVGTFVVAQGNGGDYVRRIESTANLPQNALLACTDVSYTYGNSDRVALKGISLAVPPGRVVALVGASGCGKSTLLRILAGALDASSGAVHAAPDTSVILCPQDAPVLSGSVVSNVAYPPREGSDEMVSARAAASACACATALETDLTLGWNTEVGERGGALSGGQRQRVSLSRAVHACQSARRAVLLLDEPVSALDAPSALAAMRSLKAWVSADAENRAVVFVTHDPSLVESARGICDACLDLSSTGV
ncbi:ABC transporter [Pseudoscourfieldia marina]